MKRLNPYQTPDYTRESSQNSAALPGWLTLAVLITMAAWAVYYRPPLGIAFPGVIAFAAAWWQRKSFTTVLVCVLLSYFVGIVAMVSGVLVTYDPQLMMDDAVRPKITRVWAGLGIFGAFVGTALALCFSR